ncbi:maleylpyruvate isomerase family mycothiol-dependent enzyme [Rhodococcus aerolatus]
MDVTALRPVLDEHLTALLTLADRGPAALVAPVAGCPGYSVADLLGHLSAVHRWATEVLTTREPARAPEPPADPADALAQVAVTAAELRAALDAVAPDAPCWGFGPKPRIAGFWVRRMAQEHAVHHWDALTALGEDASGVISTEVAVDGLAEVASVFVPVQTRHGRLDLPAPVALAPDDAEGRVVLGVGDPRAELVGPAAELLLLAWRRVPLAGAAVTLSGDRAVAEEAFAAALTP